MNLAMEDLPEELCLGDRVREVWGLGMGDPEAAPRAFRERGDLDFLMSDGELRITGEDNVEGLEEKGELGLKEESEDDDDTDPSVERVGTFSLSPLDMGLFLTVLMDGLGKSKGMNNEDGTFFAPPRGSKH